MSKVTAATGTRVPSQEGLVDLSLMVIDETCRQGTRVLYCPVE